MIVRILANLAIILVDFYVLIKLNGGFLPQKKLGYKDCWSLILIQTIVGLFMLITAPMISGVRFDFRIILYVMMIKYLGSRVTLPTVLLLGMSRLYFESNLSIPLNMSFTLLIVITLPFFYQWTKNHFNELGQLLVLNDIYLIILLPLYIYNMGNLQDAMIVFSVNLLTSSAFIIVIHYVSKDIQKLFNLAVIDSLSTLYNSRQLQEDLVRLSQELGGYALLQIDIDDFKNYNDQFGHLVGDEVIRRFSRVLKEAVGDDFLAYRYGGEEFVVIVKDPEGKIAYQVAKDVRKQIRALSIPCEKSGTQDLTITASIGIAYQWREEQLLNTFKRADQAMYTAKVNGKDQIIIG